LPDNLPNNLPDKLQDNLVEEDFSFTHRDRLLNASQFTRVFNQATKSSSEFFTILSRENTEDQPRLGIVVAKRRAKRSVDRNIIKRIIRESFRLNKAALPKNDFIVILKRPIKTIKRANLRQQMETLWKQY
jgi:ribonuclease P protein component